MSGRGHDRFMEDQAVGAVFRAVRLRRRLRQEDVAAAARMDRMWVSRVERGRLAAVPIGRLRDLGAVLEIQLDLVARYRGGEVARVVSERHARMHELVAELLVLAPGWEFASEVTFSLWGERGVIDVLAWHAGRRALLIIELKTEIPDPAGLIAQVDRYRRLAPEIARDRGWQPAVIATWMLVAESDMNRRQLARHRALLRNAFPLDGRSLRRWLRDPVVPGIRGAGGEERAGGLRAEGLVQLSGLGFLADAATGITNGRLRPTKRVRGRQTLVSGAAGPPRRGKVPVEDGREAGGRSRDARDPG
jgi:transcriptional regulator with XRE-family HTH domain